MRSTSFSYSESNVDEKTKAKLYSADQQVRSISKQQAKRAFRWFSVVASTNHALNYVVNSYATSVLSPKLGAVTLGLNWTLNAVSGLLIASAIVKRLGFKRAIIISFWGYTLQIASLFFAAVVEDTTTAWTISILGSVLAGFTSAIWWTAQGVCFELCCLAIIRAPSDLDLKVSLVSNELDELNRIRADLSAEWTLIYQGMDIIVFLIVGLFPLLKGISTEAVIAGLAGLGAVTSLLGETFDHMDGEGGGEFSWKELMEAVFLVPEQFKTDLRPSLLAPFVFGFGFSTAMFYSFVNSDVISDSLGIEYVGIFESLSFIVAVLVAYPYAYISKNFTNGRHWVMQFGSLSFLATGAVVFFLSVDELENWYVIFAIKTVYGLGRGVFEGSCRAIYAEVFGKGSADDLSTAFSGQTLLAGFSGGIVYFLSAGLLSKEGVASITVINGIIAILSYSLLLSYGERMYSKIPCCCSSGRDADAIRAKEATITKNTDLSSSF